MAQESTNTFSGGLNKDLNSIATKNTLLTDSKNMTFITFNGNEMSMQNDMGNTKLIYQQTDDDGNKTGDVVDVALSEGFVPVGMKEHGGILYIASYNKAKGKGEIGTFPSPEYNTESTLKVLDSNFDFYIDKIVPIFNKEDYIEAGDCLIDYCFLGLNLDIITLSQDDRKIYTYKIINTLNGNDITKYCSNLKLDNGTAIINLTQLYNEKNKKIYIGYNNGVSDIILAAFDGTNVKYGHGSQSILTNKIYTYSNTNVQFWMYNNKGEYVLYIHNYDKYDVFYKTKDEKGTIEYNKSDVFNFPNIQKSSLGIMFQYEDIESFKLVNHEDETSIGLKKGFEKKYCCLFFDSLLTENHTKITVDKSEFKYIFYDEHYNILFEQKTPIEIPIKNQRIVQLKEEGKKEFRTHLEQSDQANKIQKEPYNKFYVYFEFKPINNNGIDLSKHTIKMTVDMSKSNLSDVGYPVKEYSNIDINLNNILVPYNDFETTTFESLYKNATNTKDYSLLFKTKLFNESITDSKCLVDKQLKDTHFKLIPDPNLQSKYLQALISQDSKLDSQGTIRDHCAHFKEDNKSFYLYDKLYSYYGTTINKLEGIDQSYNYQWTINFVNSKLNFSNIIGDKLSDLFYYKASCEAFNNLKEFDLYVFKTGDEKGSTVDSIPTSFDIIDYLNNNDNKNEYIFELSNYKRSDHHAKIKLLNGNLSSDIEYQKAIPQGTFNRYLSIYSTEEDYLTSINGNIGMFCLSDGKTNLGEKNEFNENKTVNCKIGLTTYINSIRIEQSKLNYSIENVFEKDLTQLSNGEIYPVDHNNHSLLTNEKYELYNCLSPYRVYYTGSLIKKDGAPKIEFNNHSVAIGNKIKNVYYDNPYLFKNNSGLYSRYQMVNKDSKYYLNVEFDVNDFKDYKYVMFLAYTTQNTTINSNYQMIIQDSVNQDQLFNTGNSVTINKEKGLKYNRIAILFEVDKTKNIQLEISCDKEETTLSNIGQIPLLINPILYTIDDLIEEDSVLKCQYFRAQAARLINYSIEDSIYYDVKFPNGKFSNPIVGKTSNVLDNYAPLPFYEF